MRSSPQAGVPHAGTSEPHIPTGPSIMTTPNALCVAPAPRAQRVSGLDVRLLHALAGALAPGALARALAGTGASHPQRRGEGRLCDPVLGDAVGTYVEDKAGMASQPEHACQLAEAGRGWPRLEAALSLVWCWRDVLEGELAEASGRLLST